MDTTTPAPRPTAIKNPAYPDRIHLHERAHWRSILDQAESRVAEASGKLANVTDPARKAALQRAFVQMVGARDQIADLAPRIPQEVGDLYGEDRHKLEQAVAAMNRLWGQFA